MGGFGAMSYAGRHPDLFDSAGSFSAAVDVIHSLSVVGVIGLEALADGGLPDDQFGDRVLNEANWRAHNPWDLASNLHGMTLQIDTDNGKPDGLRFDRSRPKAAREDLPMGHWMGVCPCLTEQKTGWLASSLFDAEDA